MKRFATRFVIGAALAAIMAPQAGAQSGTVSPSQFSGPTSSAAAALSRLNSGECSQTKGCDKLTGCIAPNGPSGPDLMQLPGSGDYDRYRSDLKTFHSCRAVVMSYKGLAARNPQLFAAQPAGAADKAFAAAVLKLNGEIFWAPASQTEEVVSRFGDEARSVFGPIPDADCSDAVAKTIALEVDGNRVDLVPNPSKPGKPLEFAHTDPSGKIVKWTTTIPRCDKPSLAGGVSYCGPNSRLTRVTRGDVEWLFFCRKTLPGEVKVNPFWSATDPRFPLLGTIGYNKTSGEVVFFDGREDGFTFDWSKPFISPGGKGYGDAAGRAAAEALYDPTFQIGCSRCHDNKNSHIINPHAENARVGYRNLTGDPIAAAFSLGEYLPDNTRKESAPYRVIGSGYTARYNEELSSAQVVRDPTGNCRGCHTLTNQVTGTRFAADAVAKLPFSSRSSDVLTVEVNEIKNIANHRTVWATRAGAGKIHPWMIPGDGNDLSAQGPEISDADWKRLSECLWMTGGSECVYKPLFTSCPAPESGPLGDPAGPSAITITAPSGASGNVVRVAWKYLNSLGNVPERDDVRFNIAVRETDIPDGGAPPAAGNYPTLDDAKGTAFQPVIGDIGTVGATWLLQNASFAGHLKFTDAPAASAPRDFHVDFPATCKKRYLVRLVPKRFCFDQTDTAFSGVDHTVFVDVNCQ